MPDSPKPPLERLAYAVSHDLGAPVRHIRQYLGLLKPRLGELDARAEGYIERIEVASERLASQLQDVLRYSRVLNRGGEPVLTAADEAFAAACARLRLVIASSGAVVVSEVLGEVLADPDQLEELLVELIGNALEFVEPGATPSVTLRRRASPTGVRIEVADTGIGIAEHAGRAVFDLWRRLHADGEYAGRGVGLAICELIVQRHGGTIGYESEPGRGSTFWFELPPG